MTDKQIEAEAARKKLYSEQSARIRELTGEVTADAYEKILSLFGRHTYEWYAGLWDGEIGGFYYATSGRDAEGYLPDIESTVQAVSHLKNGGMFSDLENGYTEGLPDGMKKRIVAFAKKLQSPEDGFFYHPQWEKVSESRRGRDLWWCTKIISEFGDTPLYDTPDGHRGSLGAPKCALPGKNDESAPAVEHLGSLEKWKAYLEELQISTNSYSSGNILGAITGQIVMAGKEYVDTLIKHLFAIRNPENGLFEDEVNYRTVNGLMKLLQTLSGLGVSLPYKREALNSCIEVATSPEFTKGNEHVCSVYNPFVAIDYIVDNAERYDGKEAAEELRNIVKPEIGRLLETTYKKMCIFQKGDGGFSYYRHGPSSTSQGAPVSIPGTVESDVNATGIMFGTFKNICSVLSLPSPYIYTPADKACFFELIGE